MIQIKNLRNEKPKNEWDIRVDRTSILGNPFHMRNEFCRDEVCDNYEKYFQNRIKNDERFLKEIIRIVKIYIKHEKLNLFCWCQPKRCHAEIIMKFILQHISLNEVIRF